MQSIDVNQLTLDPGAALSLSRVGPLVVLCDDRAEAVVLHLDPADAQTDPAGLSLALAVALYKDGAVSLGRAARIAALPVADMVTHLSRLGIAVTGDDPADARSDLDLLDRWSSES